VGTRYTLAQIQAALGKTPTRSRITESEDGTVQEYYYGEDRFRFDYNGIFTEFGLKTNKYSVLSHNELSVGMHINSVKNLQICKDGLATLTATTDTIYKLLLKEEEDGPILIKIDSRGMVIGIAYRTSG